MEEKKLKPITLSHNVIVSDPCYTRETWCQGKLQIKPGRYIPTLTYSPLEERVSTLTVVKEDQNGVLLNWEITDFEVGVDSGQAGIFCDSIYPNGETGDYGDLQSFYGKCCEATLGEGYRKREEWERNGGKEEPPEWIQGGTVLDQGVVSSSGYGDGGYECEVAKNKSGEIIAIRITYIPEEAFEDEYGVGEEED
jgi:hypothetical protein